MENTPDRTPAIPERSGPLDLPAASAYARHVAETALDIAYDASQRGIEDQKGRLENLRGRAAILLSAAALVTSFLGAEALKDTRPAAGGKNEADRSLQLWEIVAIGSFLLLLVAALAILWPQRKAWVFRLNGRIIAEDYFRFPVETTKLHLVRHLENHHAQNGKKLEPLYWLFQAGCLLLGIEVLAWLIDLTRGA